MSKKQHKRTWQGSVSEIRRPRAAAATMEAADGYQAAAERTDLHGHRGLGYPEQSVVLTVGYRYDSFATADLNHEQPKRILGLRS
jgi:hypothetical protein